MLVVAPMRLHGWRIRHWRIGIRRPRHERTCCGPRLRRDRTCCGSRLRRRPLGDGPWCTTNRDATIVSRVLSENGFGLVAKARFAKFGRARTVFFGLKVCLGEPRSGIFSSHFATGGPCRLAALRKACLRSHFGGVSVRKRIINKSWAGSRRQSGAGAVSRNPATPPKTSQPKLIQMDDLCRE